MPEVRQHVTESPITHALWAAPVCLSDNVSNQEKAYFLHLRGRDHDLGSQMRKSELSFAKNLYESSPLSPDILAKQILLAVDLGMKLPLEKLLQFHQMSPKDPTPLIDISLHLPEEQVLEILHFVQWKYPNFLGIKLRDIWLAVHKVYSSAVGGERVDIGSFRMLYDNLSQLNPKQNEIATSLMSNIKAVFQDLKARVRELHGKDVQLQYQ